MEFVQICPNLHCEVFKGGDKAKSCTLYKVNQYQSKVKPIPKRHRYLIVNNSPGIATEQLILPVEQLINNTVQLLGEGIS